MRHAHYGGGVRSGIDLTPPDMDRGDCDFCPACGEAEHFCTCGEKTIEEWTEQNLADGMTPMIARRAAQERYAQEVGE